MYQMSLDQYFENHILIRRSEVLLLEIPCFLNSAQNLNLPQQSCVSVKGFDHGGDTTSLAGRFFLADRILFYVTILKIKISMKVKVAISMVFHGWLVILLKIE